MYSPTCPGYLDALNKLLPKTTTPSTTTETTTTPTGTIAIVDNVAITPTGTYGGAPPPPPGSPPPLGSPPPPEGSQPPQQQQAGPAPAGPPMPGPTQQQASASQPSATSPQAKVGEVSESGGGSKSTVSLSSVLSMISSNQDKTGALEKSVVQAADAQAFSAGETAKQQAEKIAGDVQSQSSTAGGSSQTSSSQSSASQSSVMQLQGSSSMQGSQSNATMNSARLQQSLNSSGMGIQSEVSTFGGTNQQQNNFQNNTRQDFNVSMVTPSVSYSISAPTRYVPQVQIELPTLEGIKFGGNKGPVDSAMESKPMLPDANQGQQQLSSVNRNAQNNDAAGNVTIESIAKQPVGYAQYFGIMPDVAFYAPKEIYKNQKTVDNARALRQLSSDKLHQDMVNQQYK
jgi:hypothetical protein